MAPGSTRTPPGVPGTAEAGDRFGRSLDTIQVGSTTRLAVGVPGEDIGADANAGSVQLFTSDTEDIDPGPSLDPGHGRGG